MRTGIGILFFVLFQLSSFAQKNQVQGYLKDSAGKPVVSATVTLKNTTQRIIAFKRTDEKGYYELSLADTVQKNTLSLDIRHLGYKKISQKLEDNQTIYNFLMETESVNLQEVEIKSTLKVYGRNDTLKYNVDAFSKQEDRSIGDVISRMPGMEVSESGKIKHNGQDVSSLLVNGDNLLDENYSIGTKTIPYDMIKTLEVLKSYQPTRVLRNKVITNDVAINLVIKDEAKLRMTNQLKVGAGLPEQYEGELSSILFNNKWKTLSVLRGNNTGLDLASYFSPDAVQTGELLSPGTVGAPPVSKQRYYFNKSGALNTNNLVNLNDSIQLKVNVNLLADNNSMEYSSMTETYLPGNIVRYTELQQTSYNPFIADAGLTLEANKSKYFLKNNFNLLLQQNRGLSALSSNAMPIQQRINNRVQDFSNTFSYIPELKNKSTVSVDWYLNYKNKPQELLITPGMHQTTLNSNVPYMETHQTVEIPTWINKLSLSYIYSQGIIKQTYKVGMVNEFQQFLSALSLLQNDGQLTGFSGNPDNHLRWNKQEFYTAARYEYKKERWESTLYIPLTMQRIGYKDSGFALDNKENRVLVNPTLRVKYFLSAEDFMTFNYGYNNQIGDITSVYRGVVLRNYRSLHANEAMLQEKDMHQAGLQFGLQRSMQMLFINAGVGYDKILANTLSSSIISDDIVRTVVLPINNDMTTFRANMGISKFIKLIGSTADLKAIWSTTRSDQIQNGERLPFNNIVFTVSPGVEVQLHSKLRLKYSSSGIWFTSKQAFSDASIPYIKDIRMQTYEQASRFTWIPVKGMDVQFNLRHHHINQPGLSPVNYLFADASARYKVNKWKTDFELNLFNLTNIRSFETYTLSSNSFWQSKYQLRERMLLLKALFYF